MDTATSFRLAVAAPLAALAVYLSASGLDGFWRSETRHGLGLWCALPVASALHGLWLQLAIARHRHVAGVGAWMTSTALSAIGFGSAGFARGGWAYAILLESLTLGAIVALAGPEAPRTETIDDWIRESARVLGQTLQAGRDAGPSGGRS